MVFLPVLPNSQPSRRASKTSHRKQRVKRKPQELLVAVQSIDLVQFTVQQQLKFCGLLCLFYCLLILTDLNMLVVLVCGLFWGSQLAMYACVCVSVFFAAVRTK